jgi:hypothetical protein
VVGCCERGDEPSGSGATELMMIGTSHIIRKVLQSET